MSLHCGDCLELMKKMPDQSVDLVLTSPPYGNQRAYGELGLSFRNDGEWAEWTAARFAEACRVCRGLVAFVVEGYTLSGTFHPLPELLTCRLIGLGVNIRRRMIYKRKGIFGGSPDEFAQHHEIVVCGSSRDGRLPYANPKATGHPPKCKPGGAPSHHSRDGRVNRPRLHQARAGSEKQVIKQYKPPEICKASNVIDCGAVGGGNMGSRFASENEAPFPEKLARPIILGYCPFGGIVLDPFCGSGTTLAVAAKLGRKYQGIDRRQSQIDICERRLKEVQRELVA